VNFNAVLRVPVIISQCTDFVIGARSAILAQVSPVSSLHQTSPSIVPANRVTLPEADSSKHIASIAPFL
jgi:hypothetical protein